MALKRASSERIDKVTVHDGANGAVLAELPSPRPRGLVVQGDTLYVLHAEGRDFAVSSVKLKQGLPVGTWQRVFPVPPGWDPAGLAVDSHERFYISNPGLGWVMQLDRTGKELRSFGSGASPEPGHYHPDSFLEPEKLAAWTDHTGQDRLLVVENAGSNRVSEWSAEGKLLREFPTLQTKANNGYAFDPEHPEDLYLPGQMMTLDRYRVDYERHTFTQTALYPMEVDLLKPMMLRADGHTYLASSRATRRGEFWIYRLEGDRWQPSAAILRQEASGSNPARCAAWHDTNGNTFVDRDEITPLEAPVGIFSYHGQNWSDDFSLLALALGTPDLWRSPPLRSTRTAIPSSRRRSS